VVPPNSLNPVLFLSVPFKEKPGLLEQLLTGVFLNLSDLRFKTAIDMKDDDDADDDLFIMMMCI
jgi:hypothetical protein